MDGLKVGLLRFRELNHTWLMHGRRVPKSINVSEKADLEELLARVEFDPGTNTVIGLDRFQMLLWSDADGGVLRFLEAAADISEGKKRGGIVFVLAEHYLRIGSQEKLTALYSDGDAESKESILNGLWGDPSAHPGIGDFVVKLAIESMEHVSPRVRAEACRVIQNQCAWGVNVTGAVVGLTSLLAAPRMLRGI